MSHAPSITAARAALLALATLALRCAPAEPPLVDAGSDALREAAAEASAPDSEAPDSSAPDSNLRDSDAPDSGAPDASAGPDPCRLAARDLAGVRRSTRGRFVVLENVPSARLRTTRTVTVYVPEGPGPFPVLYTHDGQNVFDDARASFGSSWRLAEALAELEAQGHRVLVVAVDNTPARIAEYTPVPDPEHGGGNADAYLAFLTDELKPYIDLHFPTRCGPSHAAVLGSSLGGLVSFYAGLRRPDVFGRVAALSPSFWWADRWAARALREAAPAPPLERLWIDAGSDEGAARDALGLRSVVGDAREVASLALTRGAAFPSSLGYLEAERAEHNELAWRRRVLSALRYLFAPTARTVTHAHVFAHTNPVAPGARTAASLQLAFDDGRRMTAPPGLVTASTDTPALLALEGAPATPRALAPGDATLRLRWESTTAAGLVRVATNAGAERELVLELTAPSGSGREPAPRVSGSVDALSRWSEAGVALEHVWGDEWRAALLVPAGATVEYKYHRGAWARVEVSATNADVPNRRVEARAALRAFDRVARWRE